MSLNFKIPFFKAKPPRQDWSDLEGTRVLSKDFQAILIDGLKRKVFTAEARAALDAGDTGDLPMWQNREIEAGCDFQRDDDELGLTMSVLNWETLIGQSPLFDSDYFVSEANGAYSKFGWHVYSYFMNEDNVRIVFKSCRGKLIKYVPRYLYYLTALWNKDVVLKDGLLAGSRVHPDTEVCYCEYDVFLKNYDLDYIRSVAESMYDLGYESERWISGSLPVLPIVVFRIDVRMLPAERIPYFEEEQDALRCFSYIPPAAIDTVMHEDELPPDMRDYEDQVHRVDKA